MLVELLNVGMDLDHLVKQSIVTMMYLCPLLEVGQHSMKLIPHLQKVSKCDDRMKRYRWCMTLCGKDLVVGVMFDC